MKRLLQLAVFAVIAVAIGILLGAEGVVIPEKRVLPPGKHYFYLNDLRHAATLDRQQALEAPAWVPSEPLPTSFAKAEQTARKELRKWVDDETQWEAFRFGIYRLRNSWKWYFAIDFEPTLDPELSTTNAYPTRVTVLVDFSGRAGQFDAPPRPKGSKP